MANIVDKQNTGDPDLKGYASYKRMSDGFEESIAFKAACDLIFKGQNNHQVILNQFCIKDVWKKNYSLVTGLLFLKAENKVPSSKNSISPPTGTPFASLVIFTFVFFKLSDI